jgi:alpha-L-fucosidase
MTRDTPAWFDEAKLGVFVHWNPAAIPAFAPVLEAGSLPNDERWVRAYRRLPYAEMYQNTLAIPGSPTARHHAEHYGDLPYDAFVARFRDEMIPRWDPEPVADLAARAGARYVLLTTKMEDGFLLWPSEHPNPHRDRWQSERDVVGELATAVRARGMRFGVYYCAGIDWTFGGLPMTDHDVMVDAIPQDAGYLAYADAHWRELIDRYQPSVLWNDYGYPAAADVPGLFAYYYERVPDGVANNRFGGHPFASEPPDHTHFDFVVREYSTDPPADPQVKWEVCRGLGTSFGYNRQESERTYMSSTELVHTFADVVARGGNLLGNVGLTATGEVPWAQAQRLLDLGWWLRRDGDAVYGARPWRLAAGITGDGLPVRYTTSGEAVHAIVLGTSARADVEIDVRLDEGADIRLHGSGAALPWSPTPAGVRVELPEPPHEQPAISLRLAPAHAVHTFDET